MNANLYCLVMAGGKGTRFWPESTSKKPKQYLKLLGEKSLLEATLNRFDGLIPEDRRFIVTVKEQEELAREVAAELVNSDGFIFEPSGRNTAPCILLALATLMAKGANSRDVVAIVPSDHVILNAEGFRDVLADAFAVANHQQKIVTVGIPPHFPHTGYGYIEKGDLVSDGAFATKGFKEKPNFEVAKQYVASGNFLWNAGMFVGSLKVFLEEFQKHAPLMFKYFDELFKNIHDFSEVTRIYNQIPKDSIDFAVMEKTDKVLLIPARFDWNDLGSWDALEAALEPVEGNTIISQNGQYLENSKGNIVFAPNQFVTLINVQDLVVVSNDKAVLVMPKSDSQKVKNAVEYLKTQEFGGELI